LLLALIILPACEKKLSALSDKNNPDTQHLSPFLLICTEVDPAGER